MATSFSWTVRKNGVLSGSNSTNETGSATLAPSTHALDETMIIMLNCCLPLVIILGTAGNSVALWHIVRPKKVLSATEVLLLDLIIVDFLIIISAICGSLVSILGLQIQLLHAISLFVTLINLYGSPSFMTFIAIDQYIAVAHPILFHAWRRPRYYVVLSVLIWLFVLLLISPGFYVYISTFTDDSPCQTMHSMSMGWKIYLLLSEIMLNVIPALVLFACYALTAKKLVEMGVGKESMNLMRKQVLKTIGTILALLLFCFAPYHCGELYIEIMELVYPGHVGLRLYSCYVKSYTWLLTSFAAFLNPLLYIFRSQNFQWRIRCCTV
ncbi:G-protein coupled receptor 183-like, partial [Rhinoraja longicauda]